MKIYYVRHGEPNYSTGELTENGVYQAEEISHFLSTIKYDRFYSSPVKRAKETMKPTMSKCGVADFTILPFLDEDRAWSFLNVSEEKGNNWIFFTKKVRKFLEEHPEMSDEEIFKQDIFKGTNFEEYYKWEKEEIDKFFLSLGIEHDRSTRQYKFKDCKLDKIIIFAHEGVSTMFFPGVLDIDFAKYVATFERINYATISIININEDTGRAKFELFNEIRY